MEIKTIPNQIIKEPLQPLNLNKIDAIALHHMAHPNWGIKDVERAHINKGWRAIGYNFWVSFDGTIYEGRGFNLGAGVDNQNGHIISIGFQGDYHSSKISMPDAQFNSGIDIINYIKSKVPTIKFVGGHKDFMATACPGRYFPIEEMLKGGKRIMAEQITTVDQAIKNLTDKGVISSPEYWTSAAQIVTHLDKLLIKIANKM